MDKPSGADHFILKYGNVIKAKALDNPPLLLFL